MGSTFGIFIASLLCLVHMQVVNAEMKVHYFDFPGYDNPYPLPMSPQIGDYYHISGTHVGSLRGRDRFKITQNNTDRVTIILGIRFKENKVYINTKAPGWGTDYHAAMGLEADTPFSLGIKVGETHYHVYVNDILVSSDLKTTRKGVDYSTSTQLLFDNTSPSGMVWSNDNYIEYDLQLGKGLKEEPGDIGVTGAALPGKTGKGLKGEPGDIGVAGAALPGKTGLAGRQGPAGKNGIEGPKGKRGEDGPQGDQGQKGVTGEKGTASSELDGLNGEKGEKGIIGEPGENGIDGRNGDPGEPGVTGNKGAEGEAGIPGQKGETGSPGPSADKGEKGELGAEMLEAGVKGEPGEIGEPGDNGSDGNNGSPGNKGAPGIKGEAGLPGFSGSKGTKGNEGETGDTGPEGVKGGMGEQGRNEICTAECPTKRVEVSGDCYYEMNNGDCEAMHVVTGIIQGPSNLIVTCCELVLKEE